MSPSSLDHRARLSRAELAFASPRKLPRARDLRGRVVVLDVAFASDAASGGFEKITLPFIEQLGPRLAGWVDHHDHVMHARYRDDPRFVLATKAEHGACPEMVTPEVVDAHRRGRHNRLPHRLRRPLQRRQVAARRDASRTPAPTTTRAPSTRAPRRRARSGSASTARSARARGTPRSSASSSATSPTASRTPSLWEAIDRAAAELGAHRGGHAQDRRGLRVVDARPGSGVPATIRSLAFVDATAHHGKYDKTLLLLLGQERAGIAMVLDLDTVTLAARYGSGVSFLELLGLSGGMPTLVSIPKKRLARRSRSSEPTDLRSMRSEPAAVGRPPDVPGSTP